jgi:hypothetical protein
VASPLFATQQTLVQCSALIMQEQEKATNKIHCLAQELLEVCWQLQEMQLPMQAKAQVCLYSVASVRQQQ